MKPAIIEAIMVLLIIALTFAPDSFIISYFSRFTPPNMQLSPLALPILKKVLWGMVFYTILHIGAVYYSAIHSSRKMWAFIAGPGYFFIFIPVMIFVLIKKARNR